MAQCFEISENRLGKSICALTQPTHSNRKSTRSRKGIDDDNAKQYNRLQANETI